MFGKHIESISVNNPSNLRRVCEQLFVHSFMCWLSDFFQSFIMRSTRLLHNFRKQKNSKKTPELSLQNSSNNYEQIIHKKAL